MKYKAIILDMDGTLTDLYGYKDWLECIENKKADPYEKAEALIDMLELGELLTELKTYGFRIIITTWLAKGSDKEYDAKVIAAKKEWLRKFGVPYDEAHFFKYGRTKADATRKYGFGQILFDDNEKIRKGWTLGKSVDATELLPELRRLVARKKRENRPKIQMCA